MNASVHIIEVTEFHLLLDGDSRVITARLHYDPADPYVITVHFDTGVTWVLGRDLLADGLHMEIGDGDVHLRPEGDQLFLTLRSPSGEALLAASRSAIAGFMADTERVVPRGTEHLRVDLDKELARLLA
ncbi:MAG: SsgA family sporulation/cell division regulator [Acidothermus cellulolyticus]|nr:SsgA family sporulation/cell division regulator [Acidothermus cellulolyticus]